MANEISDVLNSLANQQDNQRAVFKNQGISKDDFLKLFLLQLKYQDFVSIC